MFSLPLSSTCRPVRRIRASVLLRVWERVWECVCLTCWASVSDWNVMYQLLLCANSTLITFGQLSFLNSDSTSCEVSTHTHTRVWDLMFSPQALHNRCAQVSITSTGVVSGTSLRIIIQRLWLGRTFSPFSSTCTIGEAEGCLQVNKLRHTHRGGRSFELKSYVFLLHLNTSRMRSMSVVSTLMPSMLAIVQIGTNWSLSIWDIRYRSLERFSLNRDKC